MFSPDGFPLDSRGGSPGGTPQTAATESVADDGVSSALSPQVRASGG